MKQKMNRVKVEVQAWKYVDGVAGQKLSEVKTEVGPTKMVTVSALRHEVAELLGPRGYVGVNVSGEDGKTAMIHWNDQFTGIEGCIADRKTNRTVECNGFDDVETYFTLVGAEYDSFIRNLAEAQDRAVQQHIEAMRKRGIRIEIKTITAQELLDAQPRPYAGTSAQRRAAAGV